MKKISSLSFAVLALLVFQACNDGSTDSIKSANESNEIKQDSAVNVDAMIPVTEEESKFAVKTTSRSMLEIQASELAQQKSSNQRIKDFSAMIVDDHVKVGDDLKSLAGMKNITLPPAPGEDHMDQLKKLTEKSGADFDKAYADIMIDEHEKSIKAFEEMASNASDADLRAFAAKYLPTLRSHLDAVKGIKDALK